MESYPTDTTFSPTIFCKASVVEFSPRLSLQRYVTVLQVIKDFHERRSIDTVTEFGCGSFVFFDRFLVKCDFLNLVNQIDIDNNRLMGALHMIERNQFQKRSENPNRNPLKVNIFEGNVACRDDRTDCDVVVAIEVIEHLYEKDLAMFPSTVFQFLQPKLVVITTPNYDFNVLFNDGGKLRDEDHKFEFTKSQFVKWATDIVTEYPSYQVRFYGIGEAPPGSPGDIGYCTQMAIFEKYENSNIKTDLFIQEYNLIGSYTYFNSFDDRTEEEKILDTIDQAIIKYTIDDEFLLCVINDKCEWEHQFVCLPLNLIVESCNKYNVTEASLISLMSSAQNRYCLKHFENYGLLLVTSNECEMNNCDLYIS